MVCNSSAKAYRDVTRAVTRGLNITSISMVSTDGVAARGIKNCSVLLLKASA